MHDESAFARVFSDSFSVFIGEVVSGAGDSPDGSVTIPGAHPLVPRARSTGATMTIAEDLTAELRDAMRKRDKPRLNVIRQVQTEVAVATTAEGFEGEADDALYRSVIASYVKKMNKARLEFESAGERGAERAEALAFEIDYLSRWLPSTLGEEATRALVRSKIAELDADPKATGRVIGEVMRSGEELDGSLVARLVREELGT